MYMHNSKIKVGDLIQHEIGGGTRIDKVVEIGDVFYVRMEDYKETLDVGRWRVMKHYTKETHPELFL